MPTEQLSNGFANRNGGNGPLHGRALPQGGGPNHPADAALGHELRTLRRSLGWTQKTLAGMVGVTGAQLHRYETGATRVAASRLTALADAMGVRADSLTGAHREQPPALPASLRPIEAAEDVLTLLELFSRICDPRQRGAVIAIARTLIDPAEAPTGEE